MHHCNQRSGQRRSIKASRVQHRSGGGTGRPFNHLTGGQSLSGHHKHLQLFGYNNPHKHDQTAMKRGENGLMLLFRGCTSCRDPA